MTPTPPRLSFAIPYYDTRPSRAEAIASVQAQTVDDWELLVDSLVASLSRRH